MCIDSLAICFTMSTDDALRVRDRQVDRRTERFTELIGD